MGTTEEAVIDIVIANGDPNLWDFLDRQQRHDQAYRNKVPTWTFESIRPVLDTLRVLRHLQQADILSPVPIIKRSGGQWSLKDDGEDIQFSHQRWKNDPHAQ